jgi:hypothetical protein
LVARLTLAEDTPGRRASAFSTRATQEAQVMPATGNEQSVWLGDAAMAMFMVGVPGLNQRKEFRWP